MTASLIDGRKISKKIRVGIKSRVSRLREQKIRPGLGVILVASDPASCSYVSAKERACRRLGIFSETARLSASVSQSDLLNRIDVWNQSDKIHGILIQLPLPSHINQDAVIQAILPDKDVDGFHPINVGKTLIGDETGFAPCTPSGVCELLIRGGYDPSGKHTVIVGRSNIVGKPLAALLIQKKSGANATVTVCHSATKNMASYTRQADILIAAAGRAEFITGDMIKPGAVVIDVGTNHIEDPSCEKGYRLTGDVHFDSAAKVAAAITPSPGGVGPMTITMLMHNTVRSAEEFYRKLCAT
ncbi:MAG: bifunctional 5,10-methylene-tetrahydrofolate dehydrogenase/5,10-methylene-tetrahydrofolate cyclohydrolase [Candidatus Cloacimonetes bacterium 4572_55]|nr:MAG: bifunctional 5,10-methylene-tetrahydrofolate dehydrogenase/5,10-methylene-tetrahydrofolate cyclohydrolase [Candidatus Cloacimonetes bacterium 4572_55]